MQLRETRFASFSSYRGARQICMQACDFSRYSRKKRESIKDSPERGDNQIRTGDKGVADPCLTTWLCRHILL